MGAAEAAAQAAAHAARSALAQAGLDPRSMPAPPPPPPPPPIPGAMAYHPSQGMAFAPSPSPVASPGMQSPVSPSPFMVYGSPTSPFSSGTHFFNGSPTGYNGMGAQQAFPSPGTPPSIPAQGDQVHAVNSSQLSLMISQLQSLQSIQTQMQAIQSHMIELQRQTPSLSPTPQSPA